MQDRSKEFVFRLSGLCSFRQGLASPARVHVLLQQRVCSRVLRLQSKQLVDCLLRNQLSPTDLVPEFAPRFSGPCRFFEQSLILATHHYCGGELLRQAFSPSLTPYAFQFGCWHFSCRTGKSRVLRILSPDDLVMENGSQYAETNVPGFSSVFSTQVPARGRSCGHRPSYDCPRSEAGKISCWAPKKTPGDSQRISSGLTSSRLAISTR